MNKDVNSKSIHETELSEDELMLLSAEPAVIDQLEVNSPQMKSLRSRVMSRLDEQPLHENSKLFTVRENDGDWIQVGEKITKKLLYIDDLTGQESFLLRIEPGAVVEAHTHTAAEHCMILEGDVSFGDLHLHAGDYHLAVKGSRHENAYSQFGALIYIQTVVEQHANI